MACGVSVNGRRNDLVDLRDKYAEMHAMRTEEDGAASLTSVRARMRRLAEKYPGALREIDQMELGEIRRRIDSLDAALTGAGAVDAWMEAMVQFHALMRGALVVKRWLAGRKRVDAGLREDFARGVDRLPFAQDCRAWLDHLPRIASPPAGRLVALVLMRLAETRSCSLDEARSLVFVTAEPRGRTR